MTAVTTVQTVPPTQQPTEFLRVVPLDKIDDDPQNVRTNLDPNSRAIGELAASIRAQGMQQPPKLAVKSNGRYQIVNGHRRVTACRRLFNEGNTKFSTITVLVTVERQSTEKTRAQQLAENLHREDLAAIDIAKGVKESLDACAGNYAELALETGKSEEWLRRQVKLLSVDKKLLAAIEKHALSVAQAREVVVKGRKESIDAALKLATDMARGAASTRSAAGRNNGARSHQFSETFNVASSEASVRCTLLSGSELTEPQKNSIRSLLNAALDVVGRASAESLAARPTRDPNVP